MTTQHQIIAICVLAFISVPLGSFIAIKTINKLTRAPVDVLNRRGDIELVDVNLRDIDIDISSLPEYPTSQALINQIPVRWDAYPLPRFSHLSGNTATGYTPPGYSQITDHFINSPLELDSWDLIPWLIFLSIIIAFIIIIFKYFKTNVLILTLFIFGLFMNSLYAMSILIPFSFFEIDFRDSFEWELKSYRLKPEISYLKIQTLTEDIIKLLNSLKDDENYSMSLSFISSYKKWKDNKEKVDPLFIDNAIIINKESDPILISQFIMNSLDDKAFFLSNWLFKDSSINSMDAIILIVTIAIKVKI